MQSGALTFILIAIGLIVAMFVISRIVRNTAQKQMPGSRERGTHWIGHANRHDDDFDGDGL